MNNNKLEDVHFARAIFRYTDRIEPLFLDSAFLDVTGDKHQIGSAIEIARQIKQAIKEELQLTASAGESIVKQRKEGVKDH